MVVVVTKTVIIWLLDVNLYRMNESSSTELTSHNLRLPAVLRFYHSIETVGDYVKAVCKECGKEIKGQTNVTSNFLTHLKRKHKPLYYSQYNFKYPILPSPPKPKMPYSVNVSSINLDIQQLPSIPLLETGQDGITNKIVQMIISDLSSTEIVEKEGFRALIKFLAPWYDVISSSDVQAVLQSKKPEVENLMAEAFSKTQWVCIRVEMQSLDKNCLFMIITSHFILSDGTYRAFLIYSQHIYGTVTSERLDRILMGELRKYKIQNKVSWLVSDTVCSSESVSLMYRCGLPGFADTIPQSEDETALKCPNSETFRESIKLLSFPLQRLPCFIHNIEMCISDALSTTTFRSVLKKVAILLQRGLQNLIKVKEIQPCWVWQLAQIQQIIYTEFEITIESEHCTLTSSDKEVLREILEVLKPFQEALELLYNSNEVSLSLSAPSITGFLAHLEIMMGKMKWGSEIASRLLLSIQQRLNYMLHDPVCIAAAVLDPRFKTAWCLNAAHRLECRHQVLELLNQSIQRNCLNSSAQTNSSGLSFLQLSTPEQCLDRSLEEQFTLYLEEPIAEQKYNPLAYWQLKWKDYPILWSLAQKVLAVPLSPALTDHFYKDKLKNTKDLNSSKLDLLIFLRENDFLLKK